MIVGKITTRDLLTKLSESSNQYFPTGSKYTGTDNSQSDWDFFAQDCPEVRNELESMGFQLLHGEYYGDNCTNAVMRIHYQSSWIDIQLVNDVEVKTQAQNLLESLGLLSEFHGQKQKRRELWNAAYAYVQSHDIKPKAREWHGVAVNDICLGCGMDLRKCKCDYPNPSKY